MLIWLGKQLLGQADKQETKQETCIVGKVAQMVLSPKDEEFLRRKSALASQSGDHLAGSPEGRARERSEDESCPQE